MNDEKILKRDLFGEVALGSEAGVPVVIRRSVFESQGGYRDAGLAEDYDLWLRLLQRGVDFAKVLRLANSE